MPLPGFRRIFPSKQDDTVRLEDNVATALAPLLSSPMAGAVLHEGITLLAGANTIRHGLGRELRGWWLADNTADSRVWRTASILPDRTLVLNTSADTVVSIWVF